MKLTESVEEWDDHIDLEGLFPEIGEATEVSRRRQYYRFLDGYLLAPLRIAWSDWRARLGIFIIFVYLFMGLVWERFYSRSYMNAAPVNIQPFDPNYTHVVFGFEVWKYPLGTTQFGRPVLQRIVNATPMMLQFVLAGSVVSIGLAIVIGVTAGYKSGFVDDVLMGITDVVLTIPGLPLVILLASVLEPRSPFILGMILAIDEWPGLARALRSQVLTLREESYIEASRTMGISIGNILGKEIVPQLMPYILINAATAGKVVIVEAVALYFLGFLPSGAPNWGRMLNQAYTNGAVTDMSLFYQVLFPGLALSGLTFGLVLLSQGLDQIFNPRLRARHAKTTSMEEGDVGTIER